MSSSVHQLLIELTSPPQLMLLFREHLDDLFLTLILSNTKTPCNDIKG